MANYYNNNAKEFFDGTVNANMSEHYTAFLGKLPQGAHILDAGCGSGRDSLNFKKLGYQVTAIDASSELCKMAKDYIGQEVLQLRFQDITFEKCFDGIWACASLLHVPSTELRSVIGKLTKALKPGGILFATFKHGTFEGERNGRYFHDLTEEKAIELFTSEGIKLEEMWITKDVRPERVDEFWLNIIATNIRKISYQSIDEYIAQFPEQVQIILEELRKAIKESAPDAQEKISYQMPTFSLHGNLVHFAAFKKHIGFYPAPTGIEAFKQELSGYKGAKGSVQFPIDKPLPYDLIRKIVKYRAAENIKKAESKLKKK
ncbi:DUF1801 domain-containing protein [Cellulosilyticum sp. I15G10I2]|uniref:DUF1801 domain-containing protein n=1 Tax=Cellulosilyticum sp. I15G10I2 TaxID=1892843 RepID=UPI0009F6A720|nr:DUF1801 domain-containing protein [Cellulosilyticum sp. I15G10I2]